MLNVECSTRALGGQRSRSMTSTFIHFLHTRPLTGCSSKTPHELLIPVIIIMYAAREVEIGVLFPVLEAFNAGLIGTTRRRWYYGGGPSIFDN
jgi:hypothetical protein